MQFNFMPDPNSTLSEAEQLQKYLEVQPLEQWQIDAANLINAMQLAVIICVIVACVAIFLYWRMLRKHLESDD